jgi:hypothetical protein
MLINLAEFLFLKEWFVTEGLGTTCLKLEKCKTAATEPAMVVDK